MLYDRQNEFRTTKLFSTKLLSYKSDQRLIGSRRFNELFYLQNFLFNFNFDGFEIRKIRHSISVYIYSPKVKVKKYTTKTQIDKI